MKKSCTHISMMTEIGGFSVPIGGSNICHKLDQALHISAANSDGEYS